ncbi:MAG: hypothetical protein ACXVLQ_17035 [Bacteriovorax sp.]
MKNFIAKKMLICLFVATSCLSNAFAVDQGELNCLGENDRETYLVQLIPNQDGAFLTGSIEVYAQNSKMIPMKLSEYTDISKYSLPSKAENSDIYHNESRSFNLTVVKNSSHLTAILADDALLDLNVSCLNEAGAINANESKEGNRCTPQCRRTHIDPSYCGCSF